MSDATIRTPVCPLCSEPPGAILAGGAQAFCFNEDCKTMIWDATATLEQNLTDIHFLDLGGFPDARG